MKIHKNIFFVIYFIFFTPPSFFLAKKKKGKRRGKERRCSHLNADNVKCAWNSCIGSGRNSVVDDIFLPASLLFWHTSAHSSSWEDLSDSQKQPPLVNQALFYLSFVPSQFCPDRHAHTHTQTDKKAASSVQKQSLSFGLSGCDSTRFTRRETESRNAILCQGGQKNETPSYISSPCQFHQTETVKGPGQY